MPTVDGKKWVFEDEDGIDVNLAHVPELTQMIFGNYWNGNHDRQDNVLMFDIGQQLGLAQQEVALKAKYNPTVQYAMYGGMFVAFWILLVIPTWLLLKRRQ